MKWQDRHILIIGFKHVGKSLIARLLAPRLGRNQLDLDREIEAAYALKFSTPASCREIVHQLGEEFFRSLEHNVLAQTIHTSPAVISLGGGTPMLKATQKLLRPHCIIHVTAPPLQVFQRIMRKGLPAFFSEQEDPWVTFNRFWLERETVYKKLATLTIKNHRSVTFAIEQLAKHL